ncbi:hypothetical protein HGP28_16830 [Vibrio sp. SM6]|uniref:Uncharacterized protein n=1 Tax=Vibrio agarilyticus TaxID=2726741 RepID=A0A7X8YIE6_9VIBR|nr:hypothetical protein [Vibrio agarilyticus]NLS14530.1 hypothetical protein [Vibrio agarilyticus]
MNTIKPTHTAPYSATVRPQTPVAPGQSASDSSTTQATPATQVTLSAEGKALLAALSQIDKESQQRSEEPKTVTDKVAAFTHGALGMDHPDKVEEKEDDSYSAGQYLSGALTLGGILLAIV